MIRGGKSEVDDIWVAFYRAFSSLVVESGDLVDVEIGDESGVGLLSVEADESLAVGSPEVENMGDLLGLLLAVD